MTTEVTHKRLVTVARDWLAKRCSVVATEFGGVGEIPDAVGWETNGTCWVIEAKVSRADFFANEKKLSSISGFGVGDFKYFIFPEDMVSQKEIPEGWGGLAYKTSRHQRGYYLRKIKEATRLDTDPIKASREKVMLISLASRAMHACRLLRPLWLGDDLMTDVEAKED